MDTYLQNCRAYALPDLYLSPLLLDAISLLPWLNIRGSMFMTFLSSTRLAEEDIEGPVESDEYWGEVIREEGDLPRRAPE